VARIRPNNTIEEIQVISTEGLTWQEIEAQRPNVYDIVRNLRSQQQGRHYVVFGPDETKPDYNLDDVVWDSFLSDI
jgi:hypothetical protein